MAAVDVVKVKAVASRSQWAPGMVVATAPVMGARGVVKAGAVTSRSRWAPLVVVAKDANMAVPDVGKAEAVVRKMRRESDTGGAELANKAVAPKTWLPLRSSWSRRQPSREEDPPARRPLPD